MVVEEDISAKALTPAVEVDISSYIDPFDTSIAENIAPGKAELKVLENELVTDLTEAGGLKRSYTDPDFNPRVEVSGIINQIFPSTFFFTLTAFVFQKLNLKILNKTLKLQAIF